VRFLNRFRNLKIADSSQKCKGFFSFFTFLNEVWLFCSVWSRKFSRFDSLTFPKLALLFPVLLKKDVFQEKSQNMSCILRKKPLL